MASSSIEICNLMLSWLSVKRITSFDDETKESNFCKSNYDLARRFVLEQGDWSFAIKRDELPPLASTPLNGYNYEFLLPPSSIRLLSVYDPGDNRVDPPSVRHRVEGGFIMSDLASIYVRYVDDVKDTVKFSPSFDQAVAAYMCFIGAVPLTQDKDQQVRMYNIYETLKDDSITLDSLQGTREILNESVLENSRRLNVGLY